MIIQIVNELDQDTHTIMTMEGSNCKEETQDNPSNKQKFLRIQPMDSSNMPAEPKSINTNTLEAAVPKLINDIRKPIIAA